MSDSDNRWSLPKNPPAPLFLGEKERNLVKQLNDEISERVVGQTILYYPIDLPSSNFHQIYGESMEKNFLPPVRVYSLVKWNGDDTTTDLSVLDKEAKITINFHRKRLVQDQNLFVREGDFVLFADRFWEIVTLHNPRLLFGQQEHKFEIRAECIKARDGLFQEPEILFNTVAEIGRLENRGSGCTEQVVNVLSANGVYMIDGTNGSDTEQYIIDGVNNPGDYEGKVFYLTSVGVQTYGIFDTARKFYFNENGVWFKSSFIFE